MNNPLDKQETKENFTSAKKWLWAGIIIALLSPISGLILAAVFWTEAGLKKEAKIVLAIAIVWLPIVIYLAGWLTEQGYVPTF